MARIFLTEEEAEDWGLKKKQVFNVRKMPEKILIRVLAGFIVLILGFTVSFNGPHLAALIASISG